MEISEATIVVVGSINMDLVVRTHRIPIPGETVLGNDFGTFPGGKGANQAVAAARQGAQVTFIGRVGSDTFGKQLVNNLQNEGIDVQFIGVDDTAATGVALITLDVNGQNNIVVASGANYELASENLQIAETAFNKADVLILQLETRLDTIIAAAKLAKAQDVKVILNPAPAQVLPTELLSMVDVLIPNESEIALLTDLPVDTLEQIEIAAQQLLGLGIGCVVVTLGERGALLIADHQPATHIPSFPINVMDTTAAGDSFIGAFSVALASGATLEGAIQRGCAAGALAATRLGAQPSIPTKAAIDQFLHEKKI